MGPNWPRRGPQRVGSNGPFLDAGSTRPHAPVTCVGEALTQPPSSFCLRALFLHTNSSFLATSWPLFHDLFS